MKLSIEWARNFVSISDEQENIMMEAKKSLVYKSGTTWCKKTNPEFDIAQGSVDGAESCELVCL